MGTISSSGVGAALIVKMHFTACLQVPGWHMPLFSAVWRRGAAGHGAGRARWPPISGWAAKPSGQILCRLVRSNLQLGCFHRYVLQLMDPLQRLCYLSLRQVRWPHAIIPANNDQVPSAMFAGPLTDPHQASLQRRVGHGKDKGASSADAGVQQPLLPSLRRGSKQVIAAFGSKQ